MIDFNTTMIFLSLMFTQREAFGNFNITSQNGNMSCISELNNRYSLSTNCIYDKFYHDQMVTVVGFLNRTVFNDSFCSDIHLTCFIDIHNVRECVMNSYICTFDMIKLTISGNPFEQKYTINKYLEYLGALTLLFFISLALVQMLMRLIRYYCNCGWYYTEKTKFE